MDHRSRQFYSQDFHLKTYLVLFIRRKFPYQLRILHFVVRNMNISLHNDMSNLLPHGHFCYYPELNFRRLYLRIYLYYYIPELFCGTQKSCTF